MPCVLSLQSATTRGKAEGGESAFGSAVLGALGGGGHERYSAGGGAWSRAALEIQGGQVGTKRASVEGMGAPRVLFFGCGLPARIASGLRSNRVLVCKCCACVVPEEISRKVVLFGLWRNFSFLVVGGVWGKSTQPSSRAPRALSGPAKEAPPPRWCVPWTKRHKGQGGTHQKRKSQVAHLCIRAGRYKTVPPTQPGKRKPIAVQQGPKHGVVSMVCWSFFFLPPPLLFWGGGWGWVCVWDGQNPPSFSPLAW